MTPSHAAAESSIFLAQLANVAVRSLALAAFAGLMLTALRVRTTSARLFTWRTVLYASLLMPILAWILPSVSISVPALVQNAAIPLSHETASINSVIAIDARRSADQFAPSIPPQQANSAGQVAQGRASSLRAQWPKPMRSSLSSVSWSAIASAIYLFVALLLLLRFVIGFALTRRLVNASEAIQDPRVTAKVWSHHPVNNALRVPHVRESNAISVPVTVGPIQSTILLPAAWREWDDEKLDAVMAHELSHLSRHDALTQCMALFHRAIFWFSPLSWWLNRHIADLAEQASDEAALCRGTDRNYYARTLLGFFETLHATPQRIWWQGVSMAHAGQAEKRLEKVLAWRGAVNVGTKRYTAILIIAFAIPVAFLAASARPVRQEQSFPKPDSASNQVSPAPAGSHLEPPPPSSQAPASPALPPAPAQGVSNSGPKPLGPVAPQMPFGPVGPGPLGGPIAVGPIRHHSGYWYSSGFDDEQRFVIVTGNSDAFAMSGSSEDERHVQKLRKQIPGDFIWFQRDEKSYIIRDQATIDRARKLWAPQEELGKKQEELGRQQEALGKQQEELGARMEQVHVKVPDLTAQVDKLRAELKSLSSGATQEQIGNLQSEIGELQSQLGEVQSHAGDQQSKLGEEMGALGEKQGKLGEQQGELGRQQGELAEKASKEMKQILDDAIKNGTAKPEPGETGGASL